VNDMRRSAFSRLALLGLTALTIQNVSAGSAVAWDGHGHLGISAGYPLREAKRRAVDRCRRNGGVYPQILSATDVIGDGAIAVARRGTGSIIGVSLGRPSPGDAQDRAIKKCLGAGGINPKVISGFKG
jgi:hypothetical protein